MKILPSIAGLMLAGTFTAAAQAAPAKGEILDDCKAEIKAAIEDTARIRTSRFKNHSSGTDVTFRVQTEDGGSALVGCTYRDGIASLQNADGKMIASKTDAEKSGSW